MKLSTLCLLLMSLINNIVDGHNHGSYSQEDSLWPHYEEDWMDSICDTTPINYVSMLGTHDSRDYVSPQVFRTQTLTITSQLNHGIRAFDIRAKVNTEGSKTLLSLYHGINPLGANLEDVLDEIKSFLAKHPSEFVVMRLKDEENRNDRKFADIFQNDYYKERTGYPFYHGQKHFPLVHEVRGKIFLFQDFLYSDRRDGADYRSDDFYIQDEYELCEWAALYSKWEHIKWFLARTQRTEGKYFINYLSAAQKLHVNCIPPTVTPNYVASGHSRWGTDAPRLWYGPGQEWFMPDFPHEGCGVPVIGCASIKYEGMNTLAWEWMNSHRRFVGIVMADFPGAYLISEAILAANQQIRCKNDKYNNITTENITRNDVNDNIYEINNKGTCPI